MKRFSPAFLSISLVAFLTSSPAMSQEFFHHPDDSVTFTISSEDWVTTKTARVTVSVEAAVSDKTAGTMRADMTRAVDDIAKTDWRLTSFSRSTDQTGLERWSTSFEARMPENELNGLNDAAKRVSKAGMQITVSDIDFSPTLDETEAAKASLRAKIYKEANDQLTTLNTSLPGHNYRIGAISFVPNMEPAPMPMVNRGVMMKAMAYAAAPAAAAPESAERSEKITISATVVLSSAPPQVPAPPAPTPK